MCPIWDRRCSPNTFIAILLCLHLDLAPHSTLLTCPLWPLCWQTHSPLLHVQSCLPPMLGPLVPSLPNPKISGHPSPLALCSCSPEPLHLARSQPPPSAQFPWGVLPVLPPWLSCQCICTPPALPTLQPNRTHLPHITMCVLFHLVHSGHLAHILCPTPNVSHLFPVTALLRRWHAPSPSTAYCIFGKTCSLLAMRHYESHLNTMAPGVARARLALPCHGCSA